MGCAAIDPSKEMAMTADRNSVETVPDIFNSIVTLMRELCLTYDEAVALADLADAIL